MRLQFLGFVLFSLLIVTSGCSDDDEISSDDIIVMEGIVSIQDTFEISEGKELLIMPGTEVTFEPGALFVAHGNLTIEGTEEAPIKLIAKDPIGDHRIIQGKSGCKELRIKHTEIENGLITSYLTDNHFQFVTFRNDQSLKWNDAVARFWFGKVLIEDCLIEWNNQGEGFLLHNVQAPVIRNNDFYRVPDAIEYLHCNNGIVSGNYFEGMNDDGVDQNHCFHTMIRDNIFYKVKDRALELGSEKFGSSDSLYVINNLFVDCKVAVNIKESSFARVQNSTFFGNWISIDVHTPEDSTRISRAEVFNSVIINNSSLPASVNPRSEAMIMNCMSDEALPEGTNNIISNVAFRDPENFDFTIISSEFPEGFDASNIGYQSPQ